MVELLEALDVEQFPEESELLISSLLSDGWRPHRSRTPPFAFGPELTAERALLWKAICRHESSARGTAEAYLPDAVEFCKLLDAEVLFSLPEQQEGEEKLSEDDLEDLEANLAFRAVQIVEIMGHLDMQDEVGRQALSRAGCALAGDLRVTSSLVAPLVSLLMKIHPRGSTLTNSLLEVISNVRGELSATSSPMPDSEAEVWYRVLALTVELLKSPQASIEHGGVAGLLTTTILPLIAVEDPEIRNQALRCLGLMCLLRRSLAVTHMPILMKVMQSDVAAVQITALKAVMDLLLVFDGILASGTPDGYTMEEFVLILVNLLGDQSLELRTLAAEGLSKLFLASRTTDAFAMSSLLLRHITSSPVDEPRLSQALTVFCSAYLRPESAEDDMTPRRAVLAEALPAVVAGAAAMSKDLKEKNLTISQVISFLVDLLSLSRSEEPSTDTKYTPPSDEKDMSLQGSPRAPTAGIDPTSDASMLFRSSAHALVRLHSEVDAAAGTRALCQLVAALPLEWLSAGRARTVEGLLAACDDAVGGDKQAAKYVKNAEKKLGKVKGGEGMGSRVEGWLREAAWEERKRSGESAKKSSVRKSKKKRRNKGKRSNLADTWRSDDESPTTTDVDESEDSAEE